MAIPESWVIVERFAWMHIPTRRFIPAIDSHKRGGGSYIEPVTISDTTTPRLFLSKRSAEAFMRQWMRGYIYHCRPSQPIPSRKREDMKLVTIKLVIEPERTL